MALRELNEEEIRTWTLEEKDRWWLQKVFRGDMPQLTVRSAITGMMLGGLLSLTNLYVGAKTGWTLGVGITSVILAFAMFKILSKSRLTTDFTVLENNCMQSIATAAGYMTSPMISSLAAYMMVTGAVIPIWQTLTWLIVLAVLGVLFAFPFKRRFINDEQQPFPEGRAAGIVMDSLHHGDVRTGILKAQLLVGFGLLAAFVKLFQSEAINHWLREHVWAIFPQIPEVLDTWLYRLIGQEPKILGTSVTSLTLRPELDLPMIGAGGLMGIRTGISLLIGAAINYALLAPLMIQRGDITPDVPGGPIGFRQITFWSLWCGAAMMTTASLVAFFAKPQVLIESFTKFFRRKGRSQPVNGGAQAPDRAGALDEAIQEHQVAVRTGSIPDERIQTQQRSPDGIGQSTEEAMSRIELPLWVSAVGVPIVGAIVVWMAWNYFGVAPWLGVIALVLVFFFCLIAINSTGLTSITPIGAMGKLTQLSYALLAPGNRMTNLATAAITGEVASHSANLLMDIKPGYMLGAKPRQQAMGHVLGVLAGSILSVPVFYLVFMKVPADQLFRVDSPQVEKVQFGDNPMPAAVVWKAVADVLAGEGLERIPISARWAALVGIFLGLGFEWLRLGTKGRFPLSPVGLGLGFIVPFPNCLSMFAGSFLFWLAGMLWPREESKVNQVVVQNQEPICAGLIAGGALMGILVAVIEVFFLAG